MASGLTEASGPLIKAPREVVMRAVEELTVDGLEDCLDLCDGLLPWIKSDLKFVCEALPRLVEDPALELEP